MQSQEIKWHFICAFATGHLAPDDFVIVLSNGGSVYTQTYAVHLNLRQFRSLWKLPGHVDSRDELLHWYLCEEVAWGTLSGQHLGTFPTTPATFQTIQRGAVSPTRTASLDPELHCKRMYRIADCYSAVEGCRLQTFTQGAIAPLPSQDPRMLFSSAEHNYRCPIRRTVRGSAFRHHFTQFARRWWRRPNKKEQFRIEDGECDGAGFVPATRGLLQRPARPVDHRPKRSCIPRPCSSGICLQVR